MQRAAKGLSLQTVSASEIGSGAAVFITAEGWTTNFAAALIVANADEAAALLARAQADVASDLIIDPYLIDLKDTPDGPVPALLRERIRAEGPTIKENRSRLNRAA
jgi:hypothetical protein